MSGKQSSSRPALLGGPAAVTADHESILRWPQLRESDANAVLKVMCDGNISDHRIIRELENAYAEYCRRRFALAQNNGTLAQLVAYYSIGLQPGDEVLVPSAASPGVVLPLLWIGAVPVFCESEPQRLGIDPSDAEKRISTNTRAIVVAHQWGLPGRMTALLDLIDKYHLKLVENASQALGAYWHDRSCGALGDVSVISLQGAHLAPAGEGGMILCDNPEHYERAVSMTDASRVAELPPSARRFAATGMGLKTRISPLCAAVGLNQLGQIDALNEVRNGNLAYLSERLERMGFHTFRAPDHIDRVYHAFWIRYDSKRYQLPLDILVEALQAEGAEVNAPGYPFLHKQPIFTQGAFKSILRLPPDTKLPDYRHLTLPATEQAFKSLLQLPAFAGPDNGILDQYLQAFDQVLQHADEIVAFSEKRNAKSRDKYGNLRLVGMKR